MNNHPQGQDANTSLHLPGRIGKRLQVVVQCLRDLFRGSPLMSQWKSSGRLRGAFPTDETYAMADGSTRYRTGLALGDPLPVLTEYWSSVPQLRRGVAVAQMNLTPLPPEREHLP